MNKKSSSKIAAELMAENKKLKNALEMIRADIQDPLMDWSQDRIVKRYVDYITKILKRGK